MMRASRARPRLATAACVLAAMLGARSASADLPLLPPEANPYDPFALPDAPAPPTLPDLTHRMLAVSLETTFASIKPAGTDLSPTLPRAAAWVERLEIEQALALRRWYLGVAEEVAAGAPAGETRTSALASHPELWGRAVWASRAGLAYGGGLGAVIPVANHANDSRAAGVEDQIRVVRPWDYVSFTDDMLTLRPFVDVRDIDGRVMLQLRQGIDWSIPTRGGPARLTSRTTFYLGYRAAELFGFGVEASEVYFIQGDVADDQRAVYALSPSVRFMTRTIQPAVSAIFPVDQTIFGAADTYWALRLHLAIILDAAPAPL